MKVIIMVASNYGINLKIWGEAGGGGGVEDRWTENNKNDTTTPH